MAERARAPEYLTLEELTASPLSPVVSQFYKLRPDAPGVRRHTVVTSVYDEPGELPMERYLRVRAALAPGGDYTAPRMVSYEMRDLVHRDLVWMMALVGAGVMASLLWSFRSLVWSLVALAPVISGLAMLISLMLLTSHMFNYMNALVMPVILGIGIDNGIHVIARFRQGSSVREIVTETGRALMMTSLTTMVGFGSLVSSRYRGLASLGLVATVGMALCLFTSLVALPSLLAVIERARRGAGREGA
jgi:predicted RND superfamily exporter protein